MRRINANQEIILNELAELHAAIASDYWVEQRLDKLEKPPEGS